MRELSLFSGAGGGLLGSLILGWHLTAAVEVAIVEAIQIGSENALLVPDLFQAQCLCRLDQFSAERARSPLGELNELLRDCGPAG